MERRAGMDGFFDLHTHILPHNDDGSSSSAESLEMLQALYSQGVTRVVATPHFKAAGDEPDRFFKRRSGSASRLLERIAELAERDASACKKIPDIYLGAEVAFFSAMSNVDELSKMCISGTKYLLVEMPFEKWSMSMLEELYALSTRQNITPIIAHVDRYFGYLRDDMLDDMIANGVKIQINTDSFLSFWNRRRALGLLSSGRVHFLGSDTHNMAERAPNIDKAVAEIEKKLGKDALKGIIKNGNELANIAKPIFSREQA